MSKKIIVPIDFSEASRNAFFYAKALASIIQLPLEIIHATAERYDLSPSKNQATAEIQLQEKIKAFIFNNSEQDESLKIRIINAPAIHAIVKESQSANVFMIVMAASGKHNVMEYKIGSISSKVAQEASCPVLLLPPNTIFKSINNILYATDETVKEVKALDEVLAFNKLFGAAIHFIHIQTKDKKEVFNQTEHQIFERIFREANPSFSFTIESIPSASALIGITDYAKTNDMDITVLINKHRGDSASIFGGSLTKQLALNIQGPILVYHINS